MEMNWIPASERLPEENGRYLVSFREWDFFKAIWDVSRIMILSYWIDLKMWNTKSPIDVQAWMPLPEPYGEESKAAASSDVNPPYEIIRSIATHYGAEHQILKAVEECGELQTAVIKYCFSPSDTAKQALEHLVEEAADVYILMLQIRALFSQEVFDQFVLTKLRRQERRMAKERNMDKLP